MHFFRLSSRKLTISKKVSRFLPWEEMCLNNELCGDVVCASWVNLSNKIYFYFSTGKDSLFVSYPSLCVFMMSGEVLDGVGSDEPGASRILRLIQASWLLIGCIPSFRASDWSVHYPLYDDAPIFDTYFHTDTDIWAKH